MKNLLQFIIKYNSAFVFAILQIICIVLIVSYNDYQRSIFINSGNRITGKINDKWQGVVDYISLKEENKTLREENAILLNELAQRRAFQHEFNYFKDYSPFNYVPAKVVNITTNKIKNYITIDVGKNDGVANEMAVIGPNGVAGIVFRTSDNYSVAIPIINTGFMLSVKLSDSQYFGSLSWKGSDHRFALVSDIPGYVTVQKGDSIFTSGYSAIFPPDIPVGVVEHVELEKSTAFNKLVVKLSTDFASLRTVYVIGNRNINEIKRIEETIDD
jgi:rod shape-determining protein MreC